MFNRSGHFVTGPEVCGLYGEMIGLFLYLFWERGGEVASQSKTVAELGPGTGRLAEQMLNAWASTGALKNLNYLFVEVSPRLASAQQQRLNEFFMRRGILMSFVRDEDGEALQNPELGIHLRWCRDFSRMCDRVRSGPTRPFFICHEFFDALPALKFRFASGAWCEQLVGGAIDSNSTFRKVLSIPATPTVEKALKPRERFIRKIEEGEEIEVSPMC